MIPVMMRFWMPHGAAQFCDCESGVTDTYSESFDSLPSFSYTDGPERTSTPAIESGTMLFGAAQSGDSNVRVWYGTLGDSPSASDFDVTFYIKVVCTLYNLSWKSGCSIVFRSSESPVGGVGATYPIGNDEGHHTVLRFEPDTANTYIRTRVVQFVDGFGEVAGTSYNGTAMNANTLTKVRVVACHTNIKVYISDSLVHDFDYPTVPTDYSGSTYRPESQLTLAAYTQELFGGTYGNWIDDLSMIYCVPPG
jgi:hypothetical protein